MIAQLPLKMHKSNHFLRLIVLRLHNSRTINLLKFLLSLLWKSFQASHRQYDNPAKNVNSRFLAMESFRASSFCLNSTLRSSLSFKLRLFRHLLKYLRLKSKKRSFSIQWMALISTYLSPKPFGKNLMLRNSNTNNNDLLSGSALQMDIGNRSSTGVETIWKA